MKTVNSFRKEEIVQAAGSVSLRNTEGTFCESMRMPDGLFAYTALPPGRPVPVSDPHKLTGSLS